MYLETPVLAPPEAANSMHTVAQMEFQASLQLLADRACWVTGALGAAIALNEDGVITYCAASGASGHEPGETAAADVEPFRTCLIECWTVRRGSTGEPPTFCIVVPIAGGTQVIGFLELTSEQEFTEENAEDALRIADLVTVTVEHHDAAGRAERLEFREAELALPSLWHAPEGESHLEHRIAARIEARNQKASQSAVAEVHTCAVCGFPVSPIRQLCVECERNPESATVATTSLFEIEPEESWLSAHGYTIASIVVTAITAAIIFWLRR